MRLKHRCPLAVSILSFFSACCIYDNVLMANTVNCDDLERLAGMSSFTE